MKNQVLSMTGYGRNEVEINGIHLVTEIRSVNHRFLEIYIKLPPNWLALEELIRRQVKQKIRRGRVDILMTVTREEPAEKELQFDWKLFESFLDIQKQIASNYSMSPKLTMGDLLQHPEFWSVQEPEVELEVLKQPVLESVKIACDAMIAMRSEEGKVLASDLMKCCQKLHNYLKQIQSLAPRVVISYRDRLKQRLMEWLGHEEIDQDRWMTEVAILADKSDVSEECTRLYSHLLQFEETLQSTEPVGRRLDFLVQEMNREVNTIGSKANDQSIRALVVQSKSELEKMKEQIQNIE